MSVDGVCELSHPHEVHVVNPEKGVVDESQHIQQEHEAQSWSGA